MIEQIATVVALEGDSAWVETRRQSACGACARSEGCGAGLFAKAFGFDSPQLKVTRNGNVSIGDCVVIGIDERALVRGSFAAYMMPILFMLGFALLGETVMSPRLGSAALDLAGVLGGAVGLVVGLIWLKRHSRRIRDDRRYQPLILHRAADYVPGCG
ncbi:MAG: SoxR reducing system RseC family protein [Gammaproteobacteria bacterium]|jgi:sigma-E factor negative regulatory protein RseC